MTSLALRHSGATLAVVLIVTLGLGAGLTRLETAVGYRAFLGNGHPAVQRLDAFVDRFGDGVPVAAVWSCDGTRACESALDEAALRMAADVAGQMATVAGVLRVDSPATSPVLVEPAIGLPEARTLTRRGEPVADHQALARQALADPLWDGQIVSPDGAAGAIVVQLASSDGEISRRVVERLRAALEPYEDGGMSFALVGGPVEFVVAGAELAETMRRIVPLMVLLIAVGLIPMLGSARTAAIALGSVGVAVLWVLGLAGWLGWPETSLTQALPPLVLVVGVCDGVHLLGALAGRRDGSHEERVLGATHAVWPACVMTTATTAVGFAALATSRLESVVHFGLLAAAGVLAAFVLTFSLVPVLLIATGSVDRIRRARFAPVGRAAAAVGRWAGMRWRPVLAGTLALTIVALVGVARVRFDAAFEDLYGAQSRVVRWVDAAAVLRRAETLEIVVDAPSPGPEPDAEAFRVAAALQDDLVGIDGLGRSWALLPAMRRLNDLVHPDSLVLDGATDVRGRPGSLYRLLANEAPVLVRRWVDRDGGIRISVESDKLPQGRLRRALAEVRSRVSAAVPHGWSFTVTGPLAVAQQMMDDLRATQLRSFGLALALVAPLVGLFFRSATVGVLVMVPTILPVLLTLGAMGLVGAPLDVGSSMVAAVVIGIAVDDAIHVLTAWRQAAAEGASPTVAIAVALARTGPAVVTTSLTLAVGFATLLLSPWQSIAAFGAMAAVAILAALVAVLVVLPALVAGLGGRRVV